MATTPQPAMPHLVRRPRRLPALQAASPQSRRTTVAKIAGLVTATAVGAAVALGAALVTLVVFAATTAP
jgi:hypothetical protein